MMTLGYFARISNALLLLAAVGCSSESSASVKSPLGAAGAGGQLGGAASASVVSAGGGAVGDAGSERNPLVTTPTQITDTCAAELPFRGAGCPCEIGQTAACWTGPANMRNVRACHDGTQTCGGGGEFASWEACTGQQLSCGDPPVDPPAPPTPPPPSTDCSCVPGAVIQCDEDCAALLFCSLTAVKSCEPDGTWGPCHESAGGIANVLAPDGGVAGLLSAAASIVQAVDDAGVPINGKGPCRSMFHGCGNDDVEVFTGDCSQQFKCGHVPPRHSLD